MKNDLACFSRKPAGTAAIPSTPCIIRSEKLEELAFGS